MARVEELLAQVAALPDPAARSSVDELVRLVLELHGAGLARMLELTEQGAPAISANGNGNGAVAASPLAAFADDELIRSLLLIHNLHPVPLQQRVEQALDSVRPMMRSHKGDVELVGIVDGVVQLRLEGSCHGCPGSTATMRNAVEEALYTAAPDITGVEVDGIADVPLRASEIECLKPLPVFAATTPPLGVASR